MPFQSLAIMHATCNSITRVRDRNDGKRFVSAFPAGFHILPCCQTTMEWRFPFRRLYARVIAGHLECPLCGKLLIFGVRSGPAKPQNVRLHKRKFPVFNPITSVAFCSTCGRSWQMGIIAWQLPERRPPARPIDQIPSVQQLAELRQYAHGFYAGAKKALEPANRLIEGECTCAPLPWSASCPVHGSGGEPIEPNPAK